MRSFIGLLLALNLLSENSAAQVLVGNPFISPYTSWVDAFPPPVRAGNWRLSLHNPTLMDTNNANPPTSGGGTNTGLYEPDVLIQNNFLAPANYELNATMRTNDDDLMGLVWNYQDPNNYFRVGLRQQLNSGNFGGTEGVSVQKIVGGVVTQLVPSTPMAGPAAITQAMIDNREAFNVKVAVTGNNYEVFFNGTSVAMGSDAALVPGRKIGVQSWAQQSDVAAVTPFWGAEFESISVTQGTSTLYSESFANRPVQWRQLVMTNSAGINGLSSTISKDVLGNFGLDIDNPWIFQQSNGNLSATFGNTDFIGPAVVVDDPGAASMTNYQMQLRLGASDNDGFGVLVRAQDDNNFYRINFTVEGPGAGTTRPPLGLSVQKVRNGTWTQLFTDASYIPAVGVDTAPATPDTGLPMHDLTVGVVGNQIKIQLRDNLGNIHNYPIITDSSDPILSGSVGLATWGSVLDYFMGYGGGDVPLVTQLSAFTDFDVVVNRSTGNITLTNNGAAAQNIRGVSILSSGGGLDDANWLSIANNYDRASPPTPGNGSIDSDDAWTILSSTSLDLSEREQTGNGGTLGVGQSVNFGNAWIKSRIEDVVLRVELTNGDFVNAAAAFAGTPYTRSDLNTDGVVNTADWSLFFPNLLANLSSFTDVEKALKGDLDLDGDNDVNDFALFKADFDAVNGAGAFVAMLNNIPEPSAIMLLFFGGFVALVYRRPAARRTALLAVSITAILVLAGSASAVSVDLTTYTVENYPKANGQFPVAVWTATTHTAQPNNDADGSVWFSPDSALGKRFLGLLKPGTDDDVVGFVLGFEPGDAQIGSAADYLLIDWKGATQTFDFVDGNAFNFHHDQTTGGSMPVGLALSRVAGSPTADELWQHIDDANNPSGGVTQLARGATRGSAAYNRSNGTHLFDIRYSATNVTVLVDGVEQFNQNGSFPDGRFGLYSAWQNPGPVFSNFEALPITGFDGLSATVDQATGNITLRNTGSAEVQFDYYQLDSVSGSLNIGGWNSLSDQNFQSIGGGIGESWDEAGGSSNSSLGEAYLQSSSTLAGSGSVSIGNAYNTAIHSQDLVLKFRLASGLVLNGTVNYVGSPPGVPGDYNNNGVVDAADYVLWRNGGPLMNEVATIGSVTPEDYTEWRARFGRTSGSGSAVSVRASVPEPATCGVGLCFVALVALGGRRTWGRS